MVTPGVRKAHGHKIIEATTDHLDGLSPSPPNERLMAANGFAAEVVHALAHEVKAPLRMAAIDLPWNTTESARVKPAHATAFPFPSRQGPRTYRPGLPYRNSNTIANHNSGYNSCHDF